MWNGTTPRVRFILSLGAGRDSGVAREGDVTEQARKIDPDAVVVSVDTKRGGYAHDLANGTVADLIVQMAESPKMCIAVLVAIRCASWWPRERSL